MNKPKFDKKDTDIFLSKSSTIMKKQTIITILFFLMIIPNLYSQYYVTPNASGAGNGTISNPWTIYQAASNAIAGDTVFLDTGIYGLSSILSFNNSGTASNPIVFRGVRVDGDERYLSSGCTVLRQDNSTTNDQINLNGDYITLDNMVLLQQYPKWLVVLNGDHCTLDSVVTQYPSNVGSTSNHTVRVMGDYATLKYCYFWRSPRTVIWVRTNGSEHCTGFLMEYCTVDDYSNHYAIQCMPSPGIGGDPTDYFLESGTIRNNIFMRSGYESAIYLRNVHDYKIYNNLFVKGGGYYGAINFEATDQVVESPVYDSESIFANNTIYDDRAWTTWDSGTAELILHGFSNMGGWHFENNAVQGHSARYLYRYMIGRASSGSVLTGAVVDHNLYYLTNETVESNNNIWNSIEYTWSSWTGLLTFDNNTIINTNPNFVNATTDPDTWNFRLGTNRTGVDLSSWGITTDYDGNPRDSNNPTIGAFEFYNGVDITPPQVVSAGLIDSVTLKLIFSEVLDPATGQNINNYTITDGISVLGASLSGTQVTLSTSMHLSGNYTVTANNITDLAGNLISVQHNSQIYDYQSGTVDNLVQLPVSSVLASVVPEPNHYPEKTLDGKGYYQADPDSRWAGDTMPEWLVYDFGGVQIINQTKLSFYNWNLGRIYNYNILVSTDSINWNELRTNIQSVSEEWSIEDIGQIEARYVKIVFVANNENAWAGLWEAEFLGNILNPVNSDGNKDFVPLNFSLEQNYPNPFNPSTQINFSVAQNSNIKLIVFDILGRVVATIVDEYLTTGNYSKTFNGANLSSGIYFYSLIADNFKQIKKMSLIK